ncbi:DUF2312 domain-containing protein [Sphingomonas aracearum]|uniref:DUF2312 domain-containing protein n=2 Tax=Sphingomonas aracearum TaxID=2283317 RepID=A0A369VRL1_9SPHN|nr:DUF2312 domain-containing protein [Sphingomonas aracearum]
MVRGAGGQSRHVPTLTLVPAAPAKRGKKARHVPDPIKTNGETAAEEMRLLIERLERLHEEKDGIAQDIADVLAEAKGRGFDAKALESIRKIRKKEKLAFQEETAILETYMQSLGML